MGIGHEEDKMIKRFKILSILLLFVFLLPTLGCYQDNTLDNHVKRFVDDGMLVYNKVVTAYGCGYDSYYELCGQVDLVLPDKVYVPPFFDGKPVNVFGSTGGRSKLSMSNDGTEIYPLFNNVRSVYLPYTMDANINEVGNLAYIKSEANPFVSLPQGGPNNIFFVNPNFTGISWDCLKLSYKGIEKFYFAREDFNIIKGVLVNNEQYSNIDYFVNYISDIAGSFMLVCANTTYYFNYENNPNNGIFFINDFERGGKIENTPYEPLREGYTFAGWYKEPECINAWDFEKDKTPELEYDEQGGLIFKETSLYAKWIKE